MPEMQVSEKQALQNENNDLHQRIREKDYRIKELEAKNESLVANYSKSDIELEEENFALKATIARIDTVVARMINEEVWADDGHRIAEIIRGDKQALENDDE